VRNCGLKRKCLHPQHGRQPSSRPEPGSLALLSGPCPLICSGRQTRPGGIWQPLIGRDDHSNPVLFRCMPSGGFLWGMLNRQSGWLGIQRRSLESPEDTSADQRSGVKSHRLSVQAYGRWPQLVAAEAKSYGKEWVCCGWRQVPFSRNLSA
jgi:hypothetical protein